MIGLDRVPASFAKTARVMRLGALRIGFSTTLLGTLIG